MTRRRVVVVSSCAPPLPGHPVTGGGLRTAQLIATLRSARHSVVTLIERGALPSGAPKDLVPFELETLGKQLRKAKPSVIVLEQWALASWLGDPAAGGAPDVPLVIDLHGSLMLENVYRRGTLDVVLDGKTKLEALRRADLLLTPAAAQLHHFGSWAALAGFDPRELPLALLPLASPTAVAAARQGEDPRLRMVYGGARWPWIDSLAALQAAADVVKGTKSSRLDVFTYEPPRHGLPFEEDLGSWADVDAALAGRGKRIRSHGRTEHAAWLAFLMETATVALDLWEPNPERMLAATTRTIEFLAAGLPVVTVAGACWAEELVATGAGWAVPAGPGFRDALTELLTGLADDPARIAAASRAATALAAGRADPQVTGRALLDFVGQPTRPPRAERSVVEAIVEVRQAHLDETLRSQAAAHADEHARLVADHRAETATLRERHAAEVSELRATMQAELSAARVERKQEIEALSAEHRAELERREATLRAELAARADAEQVRARELRSEHRAEVETIAAAQRQEIAALREAERARSDEQRGEHRVEIESIIAAQREEVAALREAERARSDEQRAEHQSEVEAITVAQRAELEALREAEQRRADQQRAEHRAEIEAVASAHQVQLGAMTAEARLERERAAADADERLRKASDEARRVIEANDARFAQAAAAAEERAEAQSVAHQGAMDALRERLEGQLAARQAELERRQVAFDAARAEHVAEIDAERAAQAAKSEELRAAVEARDTWQGRWKVDRDTEKQDRTRREVELRAQLIAREEELRAEAAAQLAEERARLQAEAAAELEGLRSALQGQLDAMAARKVVRLADGAAKALGQTGRVLPATRLAKLWFEHALDRERD